MQVDMNSKALDEKYMKIALSLARKAGRVSPNPYVGAVLVKNNKIIGRGYHKGPGKQHAEVAAIESATNAKNSTLYVTLEPCNHYGKTPPCTEAIIKAKIKKVVIAVKDPNKLSGDGISALKKAGISIHLGVLEQEAKQLNEVYFKFIETGLPFVTIKSAVTIDGKIYAKNQKQISCAASLKAAHKLRATSDAIMVGINTVIADNPKLTTRLVRGSNPVRIILDNNLRIPLTANVLNKEAKTIIVTTSTNSEKLIQLEKKGIKIIKTNSLIELMKKLAKLGITSLLIEGGSKVYTSALKAGIVDKIVLFICPKIIGRGIPLFSDMGRIELYNCSFRQSGSDIMFSGYVKKF